MEKKLVLKLSSTLYDTVVEASKNENMEIEKYIIKVLEKNETSSNQMAIFKEFVLKDLQELMVKIKSTQTPYSRTPDRNFTMRLLEEYNGSIPDPIKSNIEVYKKQKMFNKKYFYLIIDKGTIVGNIGMDLHEEPMPFGSYGFIYCFNIEKSHSTMGNLQKIIAFLRESLKNKNIYNIDILTGSIPLTKDLLIKLGFSEFYTIHEAKVTIISAIEDIRLPEYSKEFIEFNVKSLQNLLPTSRKLPLKYLLNYWSSHKKQLQCKKVTFTYDNTIKNFIIIAYKIEKENIYHYTVLMEPIDLFNEEILKEVYNLLINEITNSSITDPFIISIPEEIKDLLKQTLNIISVNHSSLYRKFFS